MNLVMGLCKIKVLEHNRAKINRILAYLVVLPVLGSVAFRDGCQGSRANENIGVESNQTSWDDSEQGIKVHKVLGLVPLESGWRDVHLPVMTATPSDLLDCKREK